jgi:hypothetical protein
VNNCGDCGERTTISSEFVPKLHYPERQAGMNNSQYFFDVSHDDCRVMTSGHTSVRTKISAYPGRKLILYGSFSKSTILSIIQMIDNITQALDRGELLSNIEGKSNHIRTSQDYF